MSQKAKDLLIIYESEAEQWATYLCSIFTGPIHQGNICCFDIATVTTLRDDFLGHGQYRCKLLILSRGMVEDLCRMKRFFLSRVLNPPSNVVVLLCGVESLDPLLAMVPLESDECLQISTEHDAQEYLSAVFNILQRGKKESPRQPAKKRAKKVSRTQQMAADMRELFAEMDRDFHEKENLRIQEQRRHEERMRKEAMDHEREATAQEREARDRQMTMWREMQDSQNDLLRELMHRMPLPTPPQPVYSPLHQHHGSPAYHNTSLMSNQFKDEAVNNPRPITSSGSELKVENPNSPVAQNSSPGIVVVPSRVPCGGSDELFVLVRDAVASGDVEVEFRGDDQSVRVKPERWNERVFLIRPPDLPAGRVTVTLYCGGQSLDGAQLQYYNTMDEIARLLTTVADPVEFMCQALRASFPESLDQKLASILLEAMPTGGFQELLLDDTPERGRRHEDVPTLLHFAAQHGLKDLSGLLLQCPGARRALCTANRHGLTPMEIAQNHGHTELRVLLEETLNTVNPSESSTDASLYELMCTTGTPATTVVDMEEGEEEDPYALLGVNDDEYDGTWTPGEAAAPLSTRPPAPTPRPEATTSMEGPTPFIAQVFQKKMSKGNADMMYALPVRQAHVRRASISSPTYDTFVPDAPPATDEPVALRERVKRGSLSADQALEHFGDWQSGHKGVDALQQEKLSQLRASIVNSNQDDDGVYDKINNVYPASTVKGRRGSHPDFYRKTRKEQQSNFLWKADKR